MQPDTIIIHCSATEDGRNLSWNAIRRYHTSWKHDGRAITADEAGMLSAQGRKVDRPWLEIGYHFGIERIDDRYEILVGRQMTMPGAHCSAGRMNSHSLGVCLVGLFDDMPVPGEQWCAARDLTLALMDVFHIPWDRVYGHGEIDSRKTCPGRRFSMERFRDELRRHAKVAR